MSEYPLFDLQTLTKALLKAVETHDWVKVDAIQARMNNILNEINPEREGEKI